MSDPEHTEPKTPSDEMRQGVVALATLGIAVLLIVAASVIGVTIGMRGGTHSMMWGGR